MQRSACARCLLLRQQPNVSTLPKCPAVWVACTPEPSADALVVNYLTPEQRANFGACRTSRAVGQIFCATAVGLCLCFLPPKAVVSFLLATVASCTRPSGYGKDG